MTVDPLGQHIHDTMFTRGGTTQYEGPYYRDDRVTVYAGDSLNVLKILPDNTIDSVVTDPPYALAFMGRNWDTHSTPAEYQFWCQQWATECLRVLKPGAHLLAFGGTRTSHRLAAAIEDAGFEIRDSIAWLYGSGFPKSLDVSKAIDKAAGALMPESSGMVTAGHDGRTAPLVTGKGRGVRDGYRPPAPATEDAAQWQGWGTALKPSHEPVVVARKPAGVSDILATIGSQLEALENLWQAREADPITQTGAAADSSAATDTLLSESTAITCLNTVMSWRNCLADLCSEPSMSTIATRSSTITDLKTLSSWLAKITRASTIKDQTSPHGLTSLVSAADNLFASVVFASRATLALSAIETATGATHTEHQDEAAPDRGAFEPIVVARKPLTGTVAANVLQHGTGALNIDSCRVGTGADKGIWPVTGRTDERGSMAGPMKAIETDVTQGRWPANVVLDGHQAAELDRQSGTSGPSKRTHVADNEAGSTGPIYGLLRASDGVRGHSDCGGASRYFPVFRYTAKAPGTERPSADGVSHPTVKPLELMRWLIRLVTPPYGVVLDPFAGSGTVGEAAIHEHMHAILIEREPTYLPLIRARLHKPMQTGFDFNQEGV